ncbi:MAG: hypothetical protein HW380_418 [Magnetococcales bacterium]|nr:hypothetical protein [Magnetococcales bacterium]
MKPYTQAAWNPLEQLEGEVYAEGDTWRKLVQTEGRYVLLMQKGAWCGVRHDIFLLETPAEWENWRSL